MKTAVVILNWNTGEYLRKWLPGILDSCRGRQAEVIVADSASTDGSLGILASEFPSVRTIALDSNYGFTGGYNRALAGLDAEYYVLMNSDIEVEDGWLDPLVEWMDTHPRCGVCGPKLHRMEGREFEYAGAAGGLLDRYGYPFCRGRVLSRTEPDNGQYDSPAAQMWVSGACMMTRSSLWEKLGGLDARFFAHMEEIDYCWRAQLEGFSVYTVPASAGRHLGGGTLKQGSPFKLKLNYRNNLLMLEKNLPRTIGRSAARRRILFRRLLDAGAALVYLLGGKKDCFKAVLEAHREARSLRDSGAKGDAVNAGISGYWNICIILQSALRRDGIFKYLRSYEDNH